MSLSWKWEAIAATVVVVPLLVSVAFMVTSVTSRRPKTLGVCDERLAPCPDSPNCVSTQADRDHQRMDAIPLMIEPADAMAALKRVVSAMPRAEIISTDENYLHAEFTSAMFRFVDDVEFCLDHQQRTIHFRSASRTGHSDFGVNRKRMQAIVAAFQRETNRHDGSPKIER